MLDSKTLYDLVIHSDGIPMSANKLGIKGYKILPTLAVMTYVQNDHILFVSLPIPEDESEDMNDFSKELTADFVCLIYWSMRKKAKIPIHRPITKQLPEPGDHIYHFVTGFFGYPFDEVLEAKVYDHCFQWYRLKDREIEYMVNTWHADKSDKSSIAIAKAIVGSGYQLHEADRPCVLDKNYQMRYGGSVIYKDGDHNGHRH